MNPMSNPISNNKIREDNVTISLRPRPNLNTLSMTLGSELRLQKKKKIENYKETKKKKETEINVLQGLRVHQQGA